MKKDKNFKSNFNIKGFTKKQYSESYYNPDLYFENDDEVVFIEHSSTGDRKVHIGELCQFVTATSKLPKNMILVLDGEGENSPSVEGEKDRLKYYFESSFKDSLVKNIKFIGVIKNEVSISGLTFNDLKKICKVVYKENNQLL